MKYEKILFEVNSPAGYTVICTENQYNKHILSGHEMMFGNIETIKNVIKDPIAVYKSEEYDNRHVYFGASTGATYEGSKYTRYTKAVVSIANPNIAVADLITVFPVPEIKGNIIKEPAVYEKKQ